jgi:hypothetical protein
MLGQAVAAYKKLQMDIIGKMSIGCEEIINEVPFFDEGYISTQIERLKKEHEIAANELKIATELNIDSEFEENKRRNLKKKLDVIETMMVHYAINSLNSIQMCRNLSSGKNLKIEKLIDSLEAYAMSDKQTAYISFYGYFKDNSIESAYFLSNKVYGKLLIENKKYDEALKHLEYAVQLRVDDMELLMLLKECYTKLELDFEGGITSEVIQILE